ncbi:excalibur calcium-binding domain-containing protein [Corynebacterium mastitidis]|nr:excalibur calcium-binding domain-containing protein [Corynebacterium mastitidis]MCH6197486.1 excalibur calcium-binding domain-containing protein [Corynebacterium mastitidis]
MPDQHKPPTWKTVLAWVSVICGIIFILGGLFGSDGIRFIIGGIFFGGAIATPGLWWMYCEKQDKAAHKAAAQHTANYNLLSETDRALLGEPPTAEKMQRRWPVVSIASVVALFAGAALSPASKNEEPKGFATVETSVEVQTSVVKVTSEEVVTVTETATEEPEEEAPAEEPAAEEPAEAQPEEEQAAQEEAPAPAPMAVPEPVQQAPAAVAPATTYYSSCAQAKAAGAAPLYAGSPGYSSRLDRDGDGVACEN